MLVSAATESPKVTGKTSSRPTVQSSCPLLAGVARQMSIPSVPAATTGRLRTTIAATRVSCGSAMTVSIRMIGTTATTVRVCASSALPRINSDKANAPAGQRQPKSDKENKGRAELAPYSVSCLLTSNYLKYLL